MSKIINFLKRIWIPVLVIAFIILVFLNIFLKPVNSPSTSQTPSPDAQQAKFGNITPGSSTQTDVNGILGRPISTKTTGTLTVSEFRSSNQYRFHEATFRNGTLALIKQIVNTNDKLNVTYVTNQFGTAPFKLYENKSHSTFNLYVYPQNGIAYLGHADGTLLEIWYFEPTSFDNFLSLWAKDFSKDPPAENEGFIQL